MKNKALILTVFAIAMACLESAVVVYIRELYFADGFSIVFRPIKELIIKTELTREFATIVMLYTIACIMSKSSHKRFAWFIYSFAIWDIFYYIWLKVFINWPISVFEWDILFLLPVTWLGPVLAPVLCSFAMILLAYVIIKIDAKLILNDWLLLTLGSLVILYTFMYDYGKLFLENGFWKDVTSLLHNPDFITKATSLRPVPFQWLIFNIGLGLICASIVIYAKRNYKPISL